MTPTIQCWVTALCLVGQVLAAADEQYQVHRNAEGWRLVVKPYDDPPAERSRFWVGVQNDTEKVKAVCVASIRYVREEQSGARFSEGVEDFAGALGAPPCPDPHFGHLVLPHETHFVLVRLPLGADELKKVRLSFEVMLVEQCPSSLPCQRAASVISFEVP